MSHSLPEPWLRGPLEGISPLLMPTAFALIQAKEDVALLEKKMTKKGLWVKPAGRASAGFHLQHMAGVLDRMLTYAQQKPLTEKQMDELSDEGQPFQEITVSSLVSTFNDRVDAFISFLKTVEESELTQVRTVGRKQLPSTLIGVLFHAAEHVQRHFGQLLVTVSVVEDADRRKTNRQS